MSKLQNVRIGKFKNQKESELETFSIRKSELESVNIGKSELEIVRIQGCHSKNSNFWTFSTFEFGSKKDSDTFQFPLYLAACISFLPKKLRIQMAVLVAAMQIYLCISVCSQVMAFSLEILREPMQLWPYRPGSRRNFFRLGKGDFGTEFACSAPVSNFPAACSSSRPLLF